MPTPPTLTPDQMLCHALYTAQHAMQAAYKTLLDPLGLTYPQYLALTALWSQDGRTVGDLGAAVGLESSTLTPVIKRLEGAGLVTRARDGADERQVRVTLTPAGRAMQARAAGVPAGFLAATGLDLTRVQALRGDLQGLRDRLRAG